MTLFVWENLFYDFGFAAVVASNEEEARKKLREKYIKDNKIKDKYDFTQFNKELQYIEKTKPKQRLNSPSLTWFRGLVYIKKIEPSIDLIK